AEALPIGDHYVTLKLEGYVRKVIKAKVDAAYQEVATETLPKSEKYLLIEQSLGRVKKVLGKERADEGMLDLRTFLFIDQAVFVKIAPAARGGVTAEGYLYDLRSKRKLQVVTGATIATDAGEKGADEAIEPLADA